MDAPSPSKLTVNDLAAAIATRQGITTTQARAIIDTQIRDLARGRITREGVDRVTRHLADLAGIDG